MIELVGIDALDEAQVVDHLGEVRQHFRTGSPHTLAVPGELESRPEHGRIEAE